MAYRLWQSDDISCLSKLLFRRHQYLLVCVSTHKHNHGVVSSPDSCLDEDDRHHKEAKPQVIAEKSGCSQCAVPKHINEKIDEKGKNVVHKHEKAHQHIGNQQLRQDC